MRSVAAHLQPTVVHFLLVELRSLRLRARDRVDRTRPAGRKAKRRCQSRTKEMKCRWIRQGCIISLVLQESIFSKTARKGVVLAAKAVETQGRGGVFSRQGSGNARQRRCLWPSRQWKHKAKGGVLPSPRQWKRKAKGGVLPSHLPYPLERFGRTEERAPPEVGALRGPRHKYGTPVSGWQQQVVSRIGGLGPRTPEKEVMFSTTTPLRPGGRTSSSPSHTSPIRSEMVP